MIFEMCSGHNEQCMSQSAPHNGDNGDFVKHDYKII